MGQITTSQVSWKGCNKVRVKSQKTKITYESKTIVVQPQKLVAPVPDKVQKPTKQKSTHTHRLTAKVNTANATRKRSKDSKLRPAQPIVTVAKKHRPEHKMRKFLYILETTKKDN